MHRLLADLRAFDQRGGWYVQGALSCAHWLSWLVGWELVTARERVRVANKLAAFPAIDDALRRGEVSYSKVRAMVRVATPANEALLLDHARLMRAAQLEKLTRKYALVQRHGEDPHPTSDLQRRYVRRRDTEDGMVKIEAVLHPEEAELVWAMLDHADSAEPRDVSEPTSGHPSGELHQRADAAKRGFNRADALVSLAQGYLRGDRPQRSPIEVTLTIPKSSLHSDTADPIEAGEMGESFLSQDAARRLSCDAGVVEVTEDEHGVPLSVGRKRRTIAGALRRALYKRDSTCTFPGCTHRIFLEGRHIKHWADGGETSLSNTALLCTFHHRHVHEYGYDIELGPDQRPQFRDPYGRVVTATPPRPAAEDLGCRGSRR